MIELAPHHKRGLSLHRPVMNASGVLGFAGEYRGLVDFDRLGAFVTNALTAARRTPAAPPNAVPLPNGVVIHTGLPNPGVRAAVRRYAPEWARLGPPVIVHLAATTPAEVRRSLDILERAESVSGLELGLRGDVSVGEATRLIRAAVGGPPLIVRLPIERAAELCEAAAQAGANALTVGAPPRSTAPVPLSISDGEGASLNQGDERNITGRFYSPENFPAALEAVRQVIAKNLDVPIIGAGGIFSAANAREMLKAGAVAVQIDAALWNNPRMLQDLTSL